MQIGKEDKTCSLKERIEEGTISNDETKIKFIKAIKEIKKLARLFSFKKYSLLLQTWKTLDKFYHFSWSTELFIFVNPVPRVFCGAL